MKKQMAAAALMFCMLAGAAESEPAAVPSNAELREMFTADQADRTNPQVDWSMVGPRDTARRERVLQLIQAGALHSGDDYFHAAMVFQHGQGSNDHLMAHVLSMTALAKGSMRAKWLSAASLDRYLRTIGQPQIYATQFTIPYGELPRLAPVDPLLTDTLRRELDVPSLEEARAREAQMVRDHEARQKAEQTEKIPRPDLK